MQITLKDGKEIDIGGESAPDILVMIGVDFASDGSENLDWFPPDSLELLHIGDKLHTVIVECFEDGSDTVDLAGKHLVLVSCMNTPGHSPLRMLPS